MDALIYAMTDLPSRRLKKGESMCIASVNTDTLNELKSEEAAGKLCISFITNDVNGDHEKRILAVVGITGREVTKYESKYIKNWLDMGFSDDAIWIAYKTTMEIVGKWNWAYCNSILKSWYKKGAISIEQVLETERKRKAQIVYQTRARN